MHRIHTPTNSGKYEGQTIQWPTEKGQKDKQWPKEKGQKDKQWPRNTTQKTKE